MSNNKIDLKKQFLSLQEEMALKLSNNQKNEDHPVAKGNETELCWLKMLKDYLPKRYQADKAFVIDSNGNKSDEIDIVIYDKQYSPFLFKGQESKYIPAESVYAVFEIRPALTKKNIEYAGNKVKSVRQLLRTSAPIYHAGGRLEPKKLFTIISGILTLKSSWNPPFGKAFESSINSLPADCMLDIGCSLKDGSFLRNKNTQKIECTNSEKALIIFFLNLLNELQKCATVPAIEINQYIKSLEP